MADGERLIPPEFHTRLDRPVNRKLPELERNGRLKHVLFAEQLDRAFLDRLARTATRIRELSESKQPQLDLEELLRHKRAMLYFTQTSTRTFLSFVAACQLMGMAIAEIRDPSVSSEYKGESVMDSMRMFSSYFDVIIMRNVEPQLSEVCAYLMNDLDDFNQRSVPIVNGGSGADQHPTQAMLDIYTIQRTFEFEAPTDTPERNRFNDLRAKYPTLMRGLDQKSYAFVGDIGRGRTVRSLAVLLAHYSNVEMHFVAPPSPTLGLQPDLRLWLQSRGIQIYEHTNLASVIGDVDLIYMTRVQAEHNREGQPGPSAADLAACRLSPELVARMKDYAPILHPFPRNDEIPTTIDQDPRAMYFRQARNGIWVRAALLAHLFDVESQVETLHERWFRDRHDYNRAVL